MNINEFNRLLATKRRELDNLMRRKLPVKVGNMAKAHFQDNIRNEGFTNGGNHPWTKTKRQQSGGKSAAANYGALQSSRNHLYSSIKYVPSDYRVTVSNNLKYAPLHNWGGITNPTVTPKMRKWAWRNYFAETGINKSDSKEEKKAKAKSASATADKWKALALTKKQKLSIKIPQRQFLGESKELSEQIRQLTDSEIRNVLNS
jgi:phage gpG-like protein